MNHFQRITTFLFLGLFGLATTIATAQGPVRKNSAAIHNEIKKLQVLGSALYIAAHPDDENTRLISYLSNEKKVNTTYLSMTRGDGGQNLVGSEIRELLGIIRTQELLMARSLDGGTQLFTRANDFGYSKTPEETLEFWNKDEVMADVVWAIRKQRPDIIINRFPHEHKGGHGHHTTSAMLSVEAIKLAADPNAYPEQLEYLETWKVRRQFFNTFWWFYGSREKFDAADQSNWVTVDVGVYYPMTGISNPEIAALSRSMHKSQGFGSVGTRGSNIEYLDLLAGDMPKDSTDMFDDIDLTWSRINADAIKDALAAIDQNFDHEKPWLSIPQLVEVRNMISDLPDSFWKAQKLSAINEVILDCTGLYVDVRAENYWGTPGDSIQLSIEVTNRSEAEVQLLSANYGKRNLVEEQTTCDANAPVMIDTKVQIPNDEEYTSAYWLRNNGTAGMYNVENQMLRGIPENPRDLGVTFVFKVGNTNIILFRPLVFQRRDPVKGEVYRPFEVVPPAFVNFTESIQILAQDAPRPIQLRIKSSKDNVSGTLGIKTSEGWSVEPKSVDFTLAAKGDESIYEFKLIPPKDQNIGSIEAVMQIGDQEISSSLVEIDYDHIPFQTILKKAEARVVKVDLKRAGNRIGYIMGAGDDMPNSLAQVGYLVDILDEGQINLKTLQNYDAVILGVRAYNTSERMRFYQKDLFEYVNKGGTLITQYNTSRGVKADQVAPLPLTLSRDRVTDELAKVTVLAPDHMAMHYPNEIVDADFDHWVQERGLYFPGEWDEAYVPILSMHDKGEDPKDGSLLIANYGEGYFVYTGISWFRQLPAGVPGAFRLFTNLISLGKPNKS
jgi:LmbE family N-acetylglucosaminyl deacetylase